MESSKNAVIISIIALSSGIWIGYMLANRHKHVNIAETSSLSVADDKCLSLYYDKNIQPDGKGFPYTQTIDKSMINALKVTHPEYKKIPMEIYKIVVENMIIVCVDVVCQRKSDGKFLLFHRRDAPAASIWWWPGGRMFRGETFFDTAIRKIRDETGHPDAVVVPKGVISVWNTFFPDSSFDKDRRTGYEGTQTVNATIACQLEDDASFDFDVKAGSAWAVEAHRWVSVEEGLLPGQYDKYVRLNLEQGLQLGLIM